MKNNKGVTLISLAIMIVVLIILASIGINYNSNSLKLAKVTKFTTELEIINTQISILNQNNNYEQYKNYGLDSATQSELINKIDILLEEKLTNIYKINEADIELYKKRFQYCSKENTNEKLGIEGIEGNYLVNIQNKIAISFDGIKYNGNWYYTLEELEKDELVTNAYKVEYHEYENPSVPHNYYYVGGTWDTGYVISDSKDDKYNGNQTRELTPTLAQSFAGNLYMWIPVIEKDDENEKGINWSSVTSKKDYTNIELALETYETTYETPAYASEWYDATNAQYAYVSVENKLEEYPTENIEEADTQNILSSIYSNGGVYIKLSF